ncbi:unnamed protein product [Sympodiomycopsis kandeliae]
MSSNHTPSRQTGAGGDDEECLPPLAHPDRSRSPPKTASATPQQRSRGTAKSMIAFPTASADSPPQSHHRAKSAVGTASSTPSPETTATIPRPPNAWILYRSHKLDQLKERQERQKAIDDADPESARRRSSAKKGALTASALALLSASQDPPSSSTAMGSRRSVSPTPSLTSEATMTTTTMAPSSSNGYAATNHTTTPISTLLAQMWKHEPEDVKQNFHRLAKKKVEEHKRLWPSYKYKPKETPKSIRARQRRRTGSDHRNGNSNNAEESAGGSQSLQADALSTPPVTQEFTSPTRSVSGKRQRKQSISLARDEAGPYPISGSPSSPSKRRSTDQQQRPVRTSASASPSVDASLRHGGRLFSRHYAGNCDVSLLADDGHANESPLLFPIRPGPVPAGLPLSANPSDLVLPPSGTATDQLTPTSWAARDAATLSLQQQQQSASAYSDPDLSSFLASINFPMPLGSLPSTTMTPAVPPSARTPYRGSDPVDSCHTSLDMSVVDSSHHFDDPFLWPNAAAPGFMLDPALQFEGLPEQSSQSQGDWLKSVHWDFDQELNGQSIPTSPINTFGPCLQVGMDVDKKADKPLVSGDLVSAANDHELPVKSTSNMAQQVTRSEQPSQQPSVTVTSRPSSPPRLGMSPPRLSMLSPSRESSPLLRMSPPRIRMSSPCDSPYRRRSSRRRTPLRSPGLFKRRDDELSTMAVTTPSLHAMPEDSSFDLSIGQVLSTWTVDQGAPVSTKCDDNTDKDKTVDEGGTTDTRSNEVPPQTSASNATQTLRSSRTRPKLANDKSKARMTTTVKEERQQEILPPGSASGQIELNGLYTEDELMDIIAQRRLDRKKGQRRS